MSAILVIDDSVDIRLTLSMLLEDQGYQVIEAENPQVAQIQLKDHDVSLILTGHELHPGHHIRRRRAGFYALDATKRHPHPHHGHDRLVECRPGG